MIYLYAIIFGIYESIWRRSHGGGPIKDWYDKYIKPWLKINYRIPSVLVNLTAIFCLGLGLRQLTWWQSLIFAVVVWLFWDITFGMYMGIGRHPYPTEEEIDEYERQYPVVWLLNLIFPEKYKYGIAYDFCGMWFRFTYPLIPLLFLPTFTPIMLTLGLLVAICYYLDVWVFDWFNSEYACGFIAGVFFVLA